MSVVYHVWLGSTYPLLYILYLLINCIYARAPPLVSRQNRMPLVPLRRRCARIESSSSSLILTSLCFFFLFCIDYDAVANNEWKKNHSHIIPLKNLKKKTVKVIGKIFVVCVWVSLWIHEQCTRSRCNILIVFFFGLCIANMKVSLYGFLQDIFRYNRWHCTVNVFYCSNVVFRPEQWDDIVMITFKRGQERFYISTFFFFLSNISLTKINLLRNHTSSLDGSK